MRRERDRKLPINMSILAKLWKGKKETVIKIERSRGREKMTKIMKNRKRYINYSIPLARPFQLILGERRM